MWYDVHDKKVVAYNSLYNSTKFDFENSNILHDYWMVMCLQFLPPTFGQISIKFFYHFKILRLL
jgi:hypothetical protein